MALGEEKAEGEASSDKKAPSCGSWSRREQELSPAGPVLGEQPPRLEAEGGPASPVGGTEGLPSPACYGGVGPGSSRTCQPLANGASREPAARGSKPALSSMTPPASLETADLPSAGSQVGTRVVGLSFESPLQHCLTILQLPQRLYEAGRVGELRYLGCADFCSAGSHGQVGPAESYVHSISSSSEVTGDLLRIGDAVTKTSRGQAGEPQLGSHVLILAW